MSREVTVTTPPSRSPRAWNGEGEVLGLGIRNSYRLIGTCITARAKAYPAGKINFPWQLPYVPSNTGPSEPWPDNRDSLPSAFPWMGERRPSKHSLLGSWEVLASWRQRGGSIPLCFFAGWKLTLWGPSSTWSSPTGGDGDGNTTMGRYPSLFPVLGGMWSPISARGLASPRLC